MIFRMPGPHFLQASLLDHSVLVLPPQHVPILGRSDPGHHSPK